MISKENLIKGHLYRLRSRNLLTGVFDGNRGFIGVREKFNDRYLFTEYYSDGGPFGTAFPQEDLGPIPVDIEIKENEPTCDQTTRRPVHFERPIAEGGRGWVFTDTQEASKDIFAVVPQNEPLFRWLEQHEAKG